MILTKNPFLEKSWHPVHTKLIAYMDDEIARQLPSGLMTRPVERLVIDAFSSNSGFRSDVGIIETWKDGIAPAWVPSLANECLRADGLRS